MEYARKMFLVDPRLLDTLRSQTPAPPPADNIDKKVQVLDAEMMSIIDRKDVDDSDNVTFYIQVLQQHNGLSGKRAKEPVRVVAVTDANESVPASIGPAT